MTIARVIHCVGGVASPVLSNIYLDRMDNFVETVLIPEYTRGSRRAASPAYQKVQKASARARRAGDRAAWRLLRKQQRGLPAGDPRDPRYRRLRYVRYADDHLLGFTGPKAEAEEIRDRLARFLREDLKLGLNQDKTLITHARTGAARFLGRVAPVHCCTGAPSGPRMRVVPAHGPSKPQGRFRCRALARCHRPAAARAAVAGGRWRV